MSIEGYTFVDEQINSALTLKYKSMVALECDDRELICIHKLDVIALAKHFKLTPNDIEESK